MFLSAIVGFAALVVEPEFWGPLLGVRVGVITIEGNTDTPDRVVQELLDFVPGQQIRFGSIQELRQRLRVCPAFQTNPWRGIGPVVELIPPGFESEFRDVRIRVVDRPGNWRAYSLWALFDAGVCAVVFLDSNAVHAFLRDWEYIVDRTRLESGREP